MRQHWFIRTLLSCIPFLMVAACSDERVVSIMSSATYRTLKVGDTLVLVGQVGTLSWPAKVVDDSRNSPHRFVWSSSDTSVLEVPPNGKAIARAAGKSTVRVTYEQLISLPLMVEISPRP